MHAVEDPVGKASVPLYSFVGGLLGGGQAFDGAGREFGWSSRRLSIRSGSGALDLEGEGRVTVRGLGIWKTKWACSRKTMSGYVQEGFEKTKVYARKK
jgi:hypothetical protein